MRWNGKRERDETEGKRERENILQDFAEAEPGADCFSRAFSSRFDLLTVATHPRSLDYARAEIQIV